jgi:hypothetical protein
MTLAAIQPIVDAPVTEFLDRMEAVGDGPVARAEYRAAFQRLRSRIDLYPVPARRASVVFESASATARQLAADCLPLGIAVAMHLYPLCVLQCVPLPLLSVARLQRTLLLRAIRKDSLIVANTGSERTRGGHSVVARKDGNDIRLDGTFEYMSLATVADLALFKAPLAGGNRTVLCAADLRADTVHIGDWRFTGSMRLSDTSPVTFAGHRLPRGRHVIVDDDESLHCTSDYQRCWFHLFLADLYLARLERLHMAWESPRSAEDVMTLNELSQLRLYGLRLLDDFTSGSDIEPLKKATSAMKLRVSRMAQSMMEWLRDGGEDASELRYIRSQPTADDLILRSIGLTIPNVVPAYAHSAH